MERTYSYSHAELVINGVKVPMVTATLGWKFPASSDPPQRAPKFDAWKLRVQLAGKWPRAPFTATLLLDQERRIAELEARSPLPLEASPSPDGSTLQTMGCAGGEKQAEKVKE
jgi:hypothetical protein